MPVFFMKKEDGFLQLVQNYKTLNSITIKNKYLLSLISKLVSQLCSAKYSTKLDVCQGFNNMWIKIDNKWKIIFYTNCKLSKLLVMFFSMTNSPATFQIMMNNIFRDLIAERIMIMYLDSILIFIWILEDYCKVMYKVLEVLAKYKLYPHPEELQTGFKFNVWTTCLNFCLNLCLNLSY